MVCLDKNFVLIWGTYHTVFGKNFRFVWGDLSRCFTVPYPVEGSQVIITPETNKKGLLVYTSLTTTLHSSLSQNRGFYLSFFTFISSFKLST